MLSQIKLSTLVAVLAVPLWCAAAPDKVVYELKERCGRQVAAHFKREFGEGFGVPAKDSNISFRNHYNSRLNACMYLQVEEGVETGPSGERFGYVHQVLFDFNENRMIGSVYKRNHEPTAYRCRLNEKLCTTAQWEAQLKVYMED